MQYSKNDMARVFRDLYETEQSRFKQWLNDHKDNQKAMDWYNNLPVQDCGLCGKSFKGHGHNPSPFHVKGSCCDRCNYQRVLPRRMFC